MAGMNATTGAALNGIAHIQQSLRDILLTPIGSRVMRRDYGSVVADLIDQPLNNATLLQLYAGVAMAIAQWEPRVVLERIQQSIDPSAPGNAQLTLQIIRLDSGTPERATLDFQFGVEATV